VSALRVLLVDDEPLVRRGIRAFLADERDVEVVGEARNGAEAVSAIEALSPDLIFLDVQMPGLDGFGVVSEVGLDRMPAVVFVTAFDEYALRAFDVHAVDYLVKPFDEPRFRTALGRARERLGARRADGNAELAALLAELRPRAEYADRLLVKGNERVLVVSVDDVDYVEAADNYVRLQTRAGRHLMRETIKGLEARLDPRRFARIHRSTIVNLSRVRELQPLFNGEMAVVLKDGTTLTMSRGYRDAFVERFGR